MWTKQFVKKFDEASALNAVNPQKFSVQHAMAHSPRMWSTFNAIPHVH